MSIPPWPLRNTHIKSGSTIGGHAKLSSGVVTFALDPARGDRGEIVKRFWIEHNMVLKPAQGTYAYVPEEHVKGPHAHYNPIRISTHIF